MTERNVNLTQEIISGLEKKKREVTFGSLILEVAVFESVWGIPKMFQQGKRGGKNHNVEVNCRMHQKVQRYYVFICHRQSNRNKYNHFMDSPIQK